MPALLIIIPLLSILVLNLPFKTLMNRIAFWVAAAFCALQSALVLGMHEGFWNEPSSAIQTLLSWTPQIDNLSLVMFLAIAIVGLVALLIGRQTIKDENKGFLFNNLLIAGIAGMNGVVLANDLFSLYVFLEIAAVSSFVLIAFEKGRDAFEGAFKYLVLSAVATALILSGLALLMIVANGVGFSNVNSALAAQSGNPLVLVAIALFVTGLFIKSGIVPFHGWLPDAYSSAPAPVSVLLAGIVTKTTGVYTLIRLGISVIATNQQLSLIISPLLLIVGTISILVGAFAALGQSDFKRMLAYSSISQVGYIILGLGAGVAMGDRTFAAIAITGAVFHLFNHAIFKTLLFVNATAVETQTGTRDMDKLGGLAARMPVTGTTSIVAFLSTAGIPPLSGFWSKLLIIVGVWKMGFPGYATIAVLASLVTLAYFLSLQRRVFFGKLATGFEAVREASPWIVIPAILLASVTIGMGLATPWLFKTFLLPIGSIL